MLIFLPADRSFQTGPHVELSQGILNEISAAKVVLLDSKQKIAYDDALRTRIAKQGRGAGPPVPRAKPAPRKPAPRNSEPSGAADKAHDEFRLDLQSGETRSAPRQTSPTDTGRNTFVLIAVGVGGLLVVVGALAFLLMPGGAETARNGDDAKSNENKSEAVAATSGNPADVGTNGGKTSKGPPVKTVRNDPRKTSTAAAGAPKKLPNTTKTNSNSPDPAPRDDPPPKPNTPNPPQPPQTQPSGPVFLDDLAAIESSTWLPLARHGETGFIPGDVGQFGRNMSPDHSISMHPPANGSAYVDFNLAGRYVDFQATAGLWKSRGSVGTGNPSRRWSSEFTATVTKCGSPSRSVRLEPGAS